MELRDKSYAEAKQKASKARLRCAILCYVVGCGVVGVEEPQMYGDVVGGIGGGMNSYTF